MRLGKYLSSLTKPELDNLRVQLNLTDDEMLVFCQLSKGKSIIEVSDSCGASTRTIDNRIKSIKYKIYKLGGVTYE